MYLVLYCTVLTVACRLSQQVPVPVLFILQKSAQYTKKNDHLYINLFFTYQVPVPNKGAGADPKKSSPAPAKKPWLRPAPASGSATLLFWHQLRFRCGFFWDPLFCYKSKRRYILPTTVFKLLLPAYFLLRKFPKSVCTSVNNCVGSGI